MAGLAFLVCWASIVGSAGGQEALACGGEVPTIIGTAEADVLEGTRGRDVIDGGDGADTITGGSSRDRICGRGGDDVIDAGDGFDIASGGDGADDVEGGGGTDTLLGGPGADVLSGSLGSDRISGGDDTDLLSGGTGSDRLSGQLGTDGLSGGRGNDWLDGGGGSRDFVAGDLGDDKVLGGTGDADEVSGGLGIDLVSGGPGDTDLVRGDYGYDLMNGGAGQGDIGSFATAVFGQQGPQGTSEGPGHGVSASLRDGEATGDGLDKLFGLEDLEGSALDDVLIGNRRANEIDGGPGDDVVIGGGGKDTTFGDSGSDRCRDFSVRRSCGIEPPVNANAFVQIDSSPAGGGGLALVGGPGDDVLQVSFDPANGFYSVSSPKTIAIGNGCQRVDSPEPLVACKADGPARRVIIDLGAGDDRLQILGELASTGGARIGAGPGDDVVIGSIGDELIEAGGGSDRLVGRAGSDGLVGGIPGADDLIGGGGSDLLAAGAGCIGGSLVGGAGRDNASFAETPSHPGLLIASLAAGKAYIDEIPDCEPVRLHPSNEDIEGSFDWDVLIGDAGANSIFGQPGRDRFFGRGGRDVIDARDGESDFLIQCDGPDATIFRDIADPPGRGCG